MTSLRRFWIAVRPAASDPGPGGDPSLAAAAEAGANALSLRYLEGGHGEGCNNDSDAWTLWRRNFHHATFYGFMLCFAATAVASLYHYVGGWPAPYELPSLPKLLGVTGGVALMVGSAGLFWLSLRRHPLHGDPAQKPMDRGFIALLLLASLSGLGLWLGRSSLVLPVLPALLALHLGVVMALFLTLPYGKFAHGFYRSAALLKFAIERRLPSRLELQAD